MSANKELGLDRPITRRQFCQGVAVSIGASLGGLACAGEFVGSPEIDGNYYPPGRSGLRGAHRGAFEAAHATALGSRHWGRGEPTGEPRFDLIVVGAGISGLAAAHFYRAHRRAARILVLDNHDDFGGHAKRNEFRVGERTLIGYGGSQSLDTPSAYSPQAKRLLEELAIDLGVFEHAFDRGFHRRHGLEESFFLDRKTFGIERLVRGNPLWSFRDDHRYDAARFADQVTTGDHDAAALRRILSADGDWLPGIPGREKIARLRGQSYEHYLRDRAGASDYLLKLINPLPTPIWGVGADAISAREAMYLGLPGFAGLGLDPARDDPHAPPAHEEPYIFHFPDGNAALARALVRRLVPDAMAGSTMHDLVTARCDYTALDRPANAVKIRLNATAVTIIHTGDAGTKSEVTVRYVKGGRVHEVRAAHAIFAGYSAMLAHICPEFPSDQAREFARLVKVPLLYANVLLRDWSSFARLGIDSVLYPGGLLDRATLDFPVSMGGYRFPDSPAEPMVVHFGFVPTAPGRGLDSRAQHRIGRRRMLELSFRDYERAIRRQLDAALGPGGFDPARDILALTLNRWPHGYAYEYNDLYDPPGWNRHRGPHLHARRPFGRVSIAGSDAEAYAYVDGAIDSAWRAVQERL